MISVTVIGCGYMGQNHAHAVRDHPVTELTSVVDVDEQHVEEVAEKYGARRGLTDYREALDEVDAAVVASPEPFHAEHARAAFERECHLILEKPIAAEQDEAWELVDRAAETPVVSGTGFILRYDPGYAQARSSVEEGELGEPVSLRAKRAITRHESLRIGGRGHPLFYMSVHDIDAMRMCTGREVVEVQAMQRRGELEEVDVPDAVQALLRFDNGAVGVLEGYGIMPDDTPGGIEAGFELLGTRGRLQVDTPGTTLTLHTDRYDRPDTRHWPVVNGRMDGDVKRQLSWFVKAIRDGGSLLASIEDGARAQTVAAAVEKAAETGETQPVRYPDSP